MAADSTPAVSAEGLSHRYGTHLALSDVSLTVPSGRLFGLLGPNGGGKTTFFRILSTLIRPSEGRAQVAGHDTVEAPHAVRQALGVVFQQPALDDELTVAENLRVHGALYGLHGRALDDRLTQLLEAFGLADRRDSRVKTLSGGLQRRADLARGLLHRPRVLLLDEPTSGLDPVARRAFWQALGKLRRQEGTTMLVATHLMEEAEACDHVAIIDQGRLVAEGTPDALKEEVGEETLWLDADDPHELAERIAAQMNLPARVLGQQVQIAHPEAHTLIAPLYDAFGEHLQGATVRQPTLEDVFMVHAGHRLDDVADEPTDEATASLAQ